MTWREAITKFRGSLRWWLIVAPIVAYYFFFINAEAAILGKQRATDLLFYFMIPGMVVVGYLGRNTAPWLRHYKRGTDALLGWMGAFCRLLMYGGIAALVPFSLFHVYNSYFYAPRNPPELYRCPIVSVEHVLRNPGSRFRAHWETDVIFNGRRETVFGASSELQQLKHTPAVRDYDAILTVRQGLLGTYVLDSWHPEKRQSTP